VRAGEVALNSTLRVSFSLLRLAGATHCGGHSRGQIRVSALADDKGLITGMTGSEIHDF
jgi:hypothetical protein